MTPSITTATAASAKASTDASTKGNALSSLGSNFSDFLTLLMTQLKNQDPTSPLDTNQFTSQLVQFTSVEQQINTNSSLTKLIQLTQGGEVLQFTTSGSEPVSIGIYSDAGVKLRDAVVTSQPGRNDWLWDGKDSQGIAVPDGAYRTIVSTQTDGNTQTGSATQELPFTVRGVATGVQKAGSTL